MISDVDAIVEEVSEAAYEKACEVVTETVQAETVKADPQYGQQRSWERVNKPKPPDPPGDGFVDLSDIPCEQLEMPEEWLKEAK